MELNALGLQFLDRRLAGRDEDLERTRGERQRDKQWMPSQEKQRHCVGTKRETHDERRFIKQAMNTASTVTDTALCDNF